MIRAWNAIKRISRISHFRDFRSGRFWLVSIIGLLENKLFAYTIWTSCDKRIKTDQYVCLITRSRMICNMTYFDLCPKIMSPGLVKVGTSPRHRHWSSRSHCEHSFSPNDLKLHGTIRDGYIQNAYLGVLIFVTSGRIIFFNLPPL